MRNYLVSETTLTLDDSIDRSISVLKGGHDKFSLMTEFGIILVELTREDTVPWRRRVWVYTPTDAPMTGFVSNHIQKGFDYYIQIKFANGVDLRKHTDILISFVIYGMCTAWVKYVCKELKVGVLDPIIYDRAASIYIKHRVCTDVCSFIIARELLATNVSPIFAKVMVTNDRVRMLTDLIDVHISKIHDHKSYQIRFAQHRVDLFWNNMIELLTQRFYPTDGDKIYDAIASNDPNMTNTEFVIKFVNAYSLDHFPEETGNETKLKRSPKSDDKKLK